MKPSIRRAGLMLRDEAKSIARRSIAAMVMLFRVMVPVSFAVATLGWTGVLGSVSRIIGPGMRYFGIPGEASFAILSGFLLSNYSAIAAMSTLGLDPRQTLIVAVMCLMCHNLPIETAIMKKTGSPAVRMIAVRVLSAFATAFVLNLVLPRSMSGGATIATISGSRDPYLRMLAGWAGATGFLMVRVASLVVAIMTVQRILELSGLMDAFSRYFSPVMKVFGLPVNAGFLWIVSNVVGYSYGAGVIVAAVDEGKMTHAEGDLFNLHASLSHSLLEDTILYASLSLPVFWLLVPRLIASLLVVRLERVRRMLVKRSYRVGTV